MLAFSSVDCSLCDGTAPKPAKRRPDEWLNVRVDLEPSKAYDTSAQAFGGELREAYERELLLDEIEAHTARCAHPDGTVFWWCPDGTQASGSPLRYRERVSGFPMDRLRRLAESVRRASCGS